MHFSIPETTELRDSRGSAYAAYVIHVNGARHCVVRYRQLHALHEQLRRELGPSASAALPAFPPKKFLPLSQAQLEERRVLLERYLQLLAQNPRVFHGVSLNGFLLGAQQETRGGDKSAAEVCIDIFLMNDSKVAVRGLATVQSDEVLERVCKDLDVPDDCVYYFGLFLVERKGDSSDLSVVRKLQDFESPYISQMSFSSPSKKLVLRRAYWSPTIDYRLFEHKATLNLLYLQTVSEVELGWVVAEADTKKALALMQARGAKLEYMQRARLLPKYGYMHFDPCLCDYPCSQTPAEVLIGDRELILRLRSPTLGEKTGHFRVTKMRCWKVMTTMVRGVGHRQVTDSCNAEEESKLELSFEYLMHSGELQWITVVSTQAVLMSLCLQSMVEELLRERAGASIKKAGDRTCISEEYLYPRHDGTVRSVQVRTRTPNTIAEAVAEEDSAAALASGGNQVDLSALTGRQYSVKRLSERFDVVNFRDASRAAEDVFFENGAFSDETNGRT